MAAYARLLTKLTDRGRFPALHAVIASGTFDEPDDPDAEFVFASSACSTASTCSFAAGLSAAPVRHTRISPAMPIARSQAADR